ncbi:MAG: hypothetical protein Ct9H300mP14_07070 [Gammaproteobacteria bacterium]|nr:MAG: hypothetical protein Ct9H300mP14_07070 [Gammaproteobacteria bacterium]
MSEQRLAGRKVLVTGVGRAIGPAIVRRFARRVPVSLQPTERSVSTNGREDVTHKACRLGHCHLTLKHQPGTEEYSAADQLGGLIFWCTTPGLSLVPSGNTFRRRPGTDFVNQS